MGTKVWFKSDSTSDYGHRYIEPDCGECIERATRILSILSEWTRDSLDSRVGFESAAEIRMSCIEVMGGTKVCPILRLEKRSDGLRLVLSFGTDTDKFPDFLGEIT